jgi:hypothetical protein
VTRGEKEVTLVLNAGDADEGFLLVSSTWPKWTRFFDRLVAAGLGTSEDIRDREGRRLGARYQLRADALTVRKRHRRKRIMSAEQVAALRDRLRHGRSQGGSVREADAVST